jgi:1,4-alpha-glucan branching enzyme
MTIRIKREPATGQVSVQFVLPDEVHPGPVSVVGTFNDWKPGAHRMIRRSNGTRSVTVKVPADEDVRFRYLGSDGAWFDDPDADEITAEGCTVRLSGRP